MAIEPFYTHYFTYINKNGNTKRDYIISNESEFLNVWALVSQPGKQFRDCVLVKYKTKLIV